MKHLTNYLIIILCVSLACKRKNVEPDTNGSNEEQEAVQTPWQHDTPWPFDQPPLATLRASDKKVFAHYFTQFPISIDNQDSASDYYQTGYLSPHGESGQHLAYGGYLRIRPLPRPPRPQQQWMELDMEEEVRRARDLGLDGFACDLLSWQGYHLDRVIMLLEAAEQVDPGFKIMLMPDMGVFTNNTEEMTTVIEQLSGYPAAYRLDDGRLVVSPYNTQNLNAQWWEAWLGEMEDLEIDIAFVPLFQGWQNYASDFAPFSYGMSDWGWRSPQSQASWIHVPAQAQAYGTIWMMPVAPQDMRPRELRYWEAGNGEEYRVMWRNAIDGGADWVQLITWNDYAEHTVVAPSMGTQYAFYDLTAFYTAWFKTGTQPTIQRDVLYYFHRIHATTTQPSQQSDSFTAAPGSDPSQDLIEVMAFLTEGGVLEIEIGGEKHRKTVPAGISTFQVPLKPGAPVFRLLRHEAEVIVLPSAFEIKSAIEYQDFLYYGGSNARLPVSMP